MLISQLRSLQIKRFTGQLEIKPLTGKPWQLYFGFGQLLWADGGTHPHRSCRRLLLQYCPQVTFEERIISQAEKFKCSHYRLLTIFLERQQINRKQFISLVTSKIIEVLFDLLEVQTSLPITYSFLPTSADYLLASGLKLSNALLPVEPLVRQVQYLFIPSNKYLATWSQYCQNHPERCSLNLAPSWTNKKQLAQQVSPQTYQLLVKLINGQRTLRDLAFLTNQDVRRFSCSLIPYLRQGCLELIEIPDLQKITTTAKFVGGSVSVSPSSSTAQPLIASVDDSKVASYALKQIITAKGYRFLSLHDSLTAIVTLLKTKPDLIFLDLMMPGLNGYQLCSQLRKISSFQKVPLVILTSQDGLVDRVQAKLRGSTHFLSKPIQADRVMPLLNNYFSPVTKQLTHE